jgi:carboxymethylenebutenolidase
MGEMVEFAANGGMAQGYLALPASGAGPGVIVLQEWWGLVPHIKDVADRFAAEGFVALAPDLYHGEVGKSPDEAGKLMMALNIGETEKDLRGAVNYLQNHSAATGGKIGAVGFCMGGMLSLFAATKNAAVGACVVFYGVHPAVKLELDGLQAPVLGLYAEKDAFVTPEVVRQLEAALKAHGKACEMKIYEDADHAFFNDTRPEVYNAEYAADAWRRVLEFYRANLG